VSNKSLAIYQINLKTFSFYYHRISELYNVINVLYTPPWIRIGPYIIGMSTAYILMRLNYKLTLKKVKYDLEIYLHFRYKNKELIMKVAA